MLRARFALLALAVAWIGLATSPALATPRCTKTCRQETAGCARTRCATLHGQARQGCLNTCRGIGGCAPIRTLAYVVAGCHTDARGAVGHWALNIRRGDCDPVPVMEQTAPEPVPDPIGLCSFRNRLGAALFGQCICGSQSDHTEESRDAAEMCGSASGQIGPDDLGHAVVLIL